MVSLTMLDSGSIRQPEHEVEHGLRICFDCGCVCRCDERGRCQWCAGLKRAGDETANDQRQITSRRTG